MLRYGTHALGVLSTPQVRLRAIKYNISCSSRCPSSHFMRGSGHPRPLIFARAICATHAHPPSARSIGFCVIWVCVSSSSSSCYGLRPKNGSFCPRQDRWRPPGRFRAAGAGVFTSANERLELVEGSTSELFFSCCTASRSCGLANTMRTWKKTNISQPHKRGWSGESSIFPIISVEPTLYGVHCQRLAHKRSSCRGFATR